MSISHSDSWIGGWGRGSYIVTGDFIHEIRWQVRSDRGPSGQVDIQDENDPDIEACNYQLVARDLTPDMSDLNGRPDRDHFWAKDLTMRHELFHVDQFAKLYGPESAKAMQRWLNTQTATSEYEIRDTLFPQAIAEGERVFEALVALPTTEEDPYGDGAPLYQARADVIKAKGDAGEYGQIYARVIVDPQVGGKEIYVGLTSASGVAIHEARPDSVPGSGLHEFFFPAKVLRTTDCTESVTVEVLDTNFNVLLTTTWHLSGWATHSDGGYEVTIGIVPP